MIGYVLWAVLFACMIGLEVVSLTQPGKQWPSLSDLIRAATRPPVGRWLLLAVWLWLGWHAFIQGWQFFLRGAGAREPPRGPSGGKSVTMLFGQILLPLALLYAGLLAMLAAGRRTRQALAVEAWLRRSALAVLTDRRTFARYTAMTLGISYAVFVAAMALYQVVIGKPAGNLVASALTGGAFLTFAVELPAFVVMSVAWALLWRHRQA